MRITRGSAGLWEPVTTTTQEMYRRDSWRHRLRYFAVLCILFGFALGLAAGSAWGQSGVIVCRPGPAGAIICTAPAVTPGTSSSAPSYVIEVPYSTPPPPLGPNQNALTYRAAIKDYCRRNLAGCGPLR